MELWSIFLAAFAAISIINFFMYGIDKRKAKKGKWRIPEKALLLTSFCGGAVGGFAAMQLFRHKTKHWYFNAVNIVGILWQIGLIAFLFIKA